jgi:hypothetical protein
MQDMQENFIVGAYPMDIPDATKMIKAYELSPEDIELFTGLARDGLGYGDWVKRNHDSEAYGFALMIKINFERVVTEVFNKRGVTGETRKIAEEVISSCYREGYHNKGKETPDFKELLEAIGSA